MHRMNFNHILVRKSRCTKEKSLTFLLAMSRLNAAKVFVTELADEEDT